MDLGDFYRVCLLLGDIIGVIIATGTLGLELMTTHLILIGCTIRCLGGDSVD